MAELSRDWVERVAAKVLPSIVTLQISDGDHSNWVWHHSGPRWADHDQQPCRGVGGPGPHRWRTVVTLNHGRTAGFDVIAADPQSDIAVVVPTNCPALPHLVRFVGQPTHWSAGSGGGVPLL